MKRAAAISIAVWVLLMMACAGAPPADRRLTAPAADGMKEIARGSEWYRKGCYQKSLVHFFKAHALFAARDYQAGVAMSLNNIGTVYLASGDTASAHRFFGEARQLYTLLADRQGTVQAMSNQAVALIEDRRFDDAGAILAEAEGAAAAQTELLSSIRIKQGILLLRQGNYRAAEAELLKVLAAIDKDDAADQAAVCFAMGRLMAATRRPEKAIGFFKQALAGDRLNGFHKGIADDLAALGDVHADLGQASQAVSFFQRSVKIYALIGNNDRVADILSELETLSAAAGIDISVTRYFVKRWLEERPSIIPAGKR